MSSELLMTPGIHVLVAQSSVSSVFLDNYFKWFSLSSGFQYLPFYAHSQLMTQHIVFSENTEATEENFKEPQTDMPTTCTCAYELSIAINCTPSDDQSFHLHASFAQAHKHIASTNLPLCSITVSFLLRFSHKHKIISYYLSP